MTVTLYQMPREFSAGTKLYYRRRLSDYPASAGWTLKLYLAGAKACSATATGDSDDHVVTLTAAETAVLSAGVYKWVERVSNTEGDVYDVASGVVTITPDLSQAGDGTHQVWLERAIAALKLHIEGRLPAALESYQVAGRVISKMGIAEADELLTRLEARLARIANPEQVTRPVLVSFTRTGFDE